jgi:UDP-2,3-diacylglucosamine pyrophosphatase LpxH
MVDVVINHGGQQVIGRSDRREIPGEMQINVFHGDNLCPPAACCPNFDTKYRTQRRFSQANHCLFSDVVQAISQTNRCSRFPFASRCRTDGRRKNYFAVFLSFSLSREDHDALALK